MLNLDFATIAFQIANFLALTALLYYFVFQPVRGRVKERRAEKERLAREMAQDREEADKLRAELEARLAEAEEEADEIIAEAQKRAEEERAALLEETYEEVERILAEAHTDAHRLQRQAVEQFHEELLDAILDISGQVIGRVSPPEVHDKLTQQLNDRIWELGRSDMERVETFRLSLGDRAPTAYVTSARDLSSEQQGELARTLTALADRHVNLELKTDASLAAGLQVRLEDIVVDSSIAGQLDELRDKVTEALKESMRNE
jgi:F-type H+-transporting ATPase subunit b